MVLLLLVLDLGGKSGGLRFGMAGMEFGGSSARELFGVSPLGLGGREGGVEKALSLSGIFLSGDSRPLVWGDVTLVGEEGPLPRLLVLFLCALREVESTARAPSSCWPSKTCVTPGWWDFRRTTVPSQPCFKSGERRSHLNFRGWGGGREAE